jgi:hypothetical protein
MPDLSCSLIAFRRRLPDQAAGAAFVPGADAINPTAAASGPCRS